MGYLVIIGRVHCFLAPPSTLAVVSRATDLGGGCNALLQSSTFALGIMHNMPMRLSSAFPLHLSSTSLLCLATLTRHPPLPLIPLADMEEFEAFTPPRPQWEGM